MQERLRIGAAVKAYRMKHDIDQKVAARDIGIPASVLSRLESGVAACDVRSLGKLFVWLISPEETR